MTQTEPAEDRYQRRRAAGELSRARTRKNLIEAADALFREHGYTATSITAVAERAGVSVQTVYLACGSKRELLRAAGTAAAAFGAQLNALEWEATIRERLASAAADPSTRAYLEALSHLFTSIASRTAPYRRMRDEAASTDPELAADADRWEYDRRRTIASVAAAIPPGELKPDLDTSYVADTLWVLASPATYDLLRTHATYTDNDYEKWLTRTLTAALTTR